MSTTADVQQVRLWAADFGGEGSELLTDQQYQSLIDANAGSLRLAAADALEIMATSEVLVSKKIRTKDLATDGPAVSAELRALAERHRIVAGAIEAEFFEIVDTLPAECAPERADRWVGGW